MQIRHSVAANISIFSTIRSIIRDHNNTISYLLWRRGKQHCRGHGLPLLDFVKHSVCKRCIWPRVELYKEMFIVHFIEESSLYNFIQQTFGIEGAPALRILRKVTSRVFDNTALHHNRSGILMNLSSSVAHIINVPALETQLRLQSENVGDEELILANTARDIHAVVFPNDDHAWFVHQSDPRLQPKRQCIAWVFHREQTTTPMCP